jgi:hypothetical protein
MQQDRHIPHAWMEENEEKIVNEVSNEAVKQNRTIFAGSVKSPKRRTNSGKNSQPKQRRPDSVDVAHHSILAQLFGGEGKEKKKENLN